MTDQPKPKDPAAVALGRKGGTIGGKATSEAKTTAARANASKPPKPGARPRGRPRNPKPPEPTQ